MDVMRLSTYTSIVELIQPSAKFKDSYLAAIREFQNDPDFPPRHIEVDTRLLENDFDSFVTREIEQAEGKNLSEGFVPQSVFWLVDGGEYIGKTSIRHRLTEHLLKTGGNIGYEIRPTKRRRGYGTALLKLAIAKAKELGIEKLLLTCDSTNSASRRIIENAGGVFESEGPPEKPGGPNKNRYWIQA